MEIDLAEKIHFKLTKMRLNSEMDRVQKKQMN